MGFLKRLLSIGSKKNKKKTPALSVDPNRLKRYHTQPLPEVFEDSEAAASRLLRSASARFAVVSESDLPPLPPLPNSINYVDTTPFAPSTRTSTIQSRGTYSVKVYGRTLHSCTEFPNANPDLDTPPPRKSTSPAFDDDSDHDDDSVNHVYPPITPRDQNRLQRLRQDPSVASLLNMYDEHGRLGSNVFSNTPSPPAEGRHQRRSTGSTLRQLMGDPSSDAGSQVSVGGDISWAERFLEELNPSSSSLASASSLSSEIKTPEEPNFIHDHSHDSLNDHFNTTKRVTFVQEGDSSLQSADNPAISSLEVELSANTTLSAIIDPSIAHCPYMDHNTETPQRASQVFQFLTEKRKPKEDRLPALPISVSPDSSASESLSPEICTEQTSPLMELTLNELEDPDFVSRIPRLRHEAPALMRDVNQSPVTFTRIPRAKGPRIPKKPNISLVGARPYAPKNTNLEIRDGFTSLALRPHSYVEANKAFIMSPKREERNVGVRDDPERFPAENIFPETPSIMYDKENSWSTHGIAPMTPVRHRSILLAKGNAVLASPASSSEMSPVGQQIMANVRKHRYKP